MQTKINQQGTFVQIFLFVAGVASVATLFWGSLAGLLVGIRGVVIAGVTNAVLAYCICALTDPDDEAAHKLATSFLIVGLAGTALGQFWPAPASSWVSGLFILLADILAVAIAIWATVTTRR